MASELQIDGYRPGALGHVILLHTAYFGTRWSFGGDYEAALTRDLGNFACAFDPEWDGFWGAYVGDALVGSSAVDGSSGDAEIRWYMLSEEMRGRGVGWRLLGSALHFCREKGYRRAFLNTVAGLAQARRLYESAGFKLIAERPDDSWGVTVNVQTMELDLTTPLAVANRPEPANKA